MRCEFMNMRTPRTDGPGVNTPTWGMSRCIQSSKFTNNIQVHQTSQLISVQEPHYYKSWLILTRADIGHKSCSFWWTLSMHPVSHGPACNVIIRLRWHTVYTVYPSLNSTSSLILYLIQSQLSTVLPLSPVKHASARCYKPQPACFFSQSFFFLVPVNSRDCVERQLELFSGQAQSDPAAPLSTHRASWSKGFPFACLSLALLAY